MKTIKKVTLRALQVGTFALAAGTLAACGGGSDSSGGSTPTPAASTISGTAAVGAPMANAAITIVCASGSGTGTADANGAFSISFVLSGPCAITGTTGTTTLHSFASGGGTFNVTPLTELLLTYLAGQFGTDLNGLLAGLATNPDYQSALTNPAVITAAENGVIQTIKDETGVTLSASAFLTTPFKPGQAGQDADLETLRGKNAFTSNGQPNATLVDKVSNNGKKVGKPTGGKGGSGNPG
ncbi:carboxypeptidase regulatory-like domain-containing protein [Burkholderia sp. Bp8963]|uniref:carboxypeptidase regulatory-like domain-containing protein n=1 Tax=Burkholderia sp. Bp8963 TaxID=2184547 RepID=UPI000F5A817E|nr:carboxypeptidase regulatory-like domain-containing protein [Burkholderia sp. Bp8963]RQS69491.1 carboxypeptidase regulatory-like domain-containing protein [Burkholderia sp. Bp8963]